MKEGMILDVTKPLEAASIPHSKNVKNPMELAMAPFEALTLSSSAKPSPLPSVENLPTKGLGGGATVAPLQEHGGQQQPLKRSAQIAGGAGLVGATSSSSSTTSSSSSSSSQPQQQQQRGRSKRAKVDVYEDAHEDPKAEEKAEMMAAEDHEAAEAIGAKSKRQRRGSSEKAVTRSSSSSLPASLSSSSSSSSLSSSTNLSSAAMLSPSLPPSASSVSSVSSSASSDVLDPTPGQSQQPPAGIERKAAKPRQSQEGQASNLEEMAAVSSLVQLSSSSISPQMVMTSGGNRSFAESNLSLLRSRMTVVVSKKSLSRKFKGTPVFAYNFKEFGC